MRKVVSFLRSAMAAWLCGAFLAGNSANAQFVVSDPPTEASTAVSHLTQIIQYANEVQEALTLVQHLVLMQREVQQLITHPSTNFLADLAMVGGILNTSQGLALDVAQMSQTFNQQFAPYSPNPVVKYAAQYSTWCKTALTALNAAAQVNGYQGNMSAGPQAAWLGQMGSAINAPYNGMNQNMQIGNSLLLELNQQLMRMQTQSAVTNSANLAAMTSGLNYQQASINAQTQFLTNGGAANTDTRIVDPITGVH